MMNPITAGGDQTQIHRHPPPPSPWVAVPTRRRWSCRRCSSSSTTRPRLLRQRPPRRRRRTRLCGWGICITGWMRIIFTAALGTPARVLNATCRVHVYWKNSMSNAGCQDMPSTFSKYRLVLNVKVIRNKQTGRSEGYGFVEFYTHTAAEKVLQTFSGHIMPNTEQPFRLNWASFSMGDRRTDVAADHSIFVGDLAADVTDSLLQETFASKYSSVYGAKVVIDSTTSRSKGYGFVRFGNDNEKTQAMAEMNGVFCSSRPMRIGPATPRKSGGFGSNGSAQGFQSDRDLSNTTVFVGGLDPNVSEDELKQSFSQYGEIASVKIPVGKQCGFVQFVQRNNAEEALQGLNGTVIGKQTVRLSWGRNPANKQRTDLNSQWNGMYHGEQVYNGYGFVLPPHDPSMYAAAYRAYPMNGNQQQVN